MHECPECGQACYCHGDIDDCEVETPYNYMHCVCSITPPPMGCGMDIGYGDDDDQEEWEDWQDELDAPVEPEVAPRPEKGDEA